MEKIIRNYCRWMIGGYVLYNYYGPYYITFWTSEDDNARLQEANILTIWFKVLIAKLRIK